MEGGACENVKSEAPDRQGNGVSTLFKLHCSLRNKQNLKNRTDHPKANIKAASARQDRPTDAGSCTDPKHRTQPTWGISQITQTSDTETNHGSAAGEKMPYRQRNNGKPQT